MESREAKETEHPLIRLARESIEAFVRDGEIACPPEERIPEMEETAGVFVCLKTRGQLRGCIGTFEPTCANVAEEIIQNAISAATRDPRFPPVEAYELAEITPSVDILTPPQRVDGLTDLDPKKYGVIVKSGFHRGLLLPDLEGVDTVQQQVEIARRKAGIGPGQAIELYRFEVKRYE